MPRQSTKEMIYSPAIIHINLFAPISLGHVSATWAPNVFRVRSFVKANGHAPVGKKKKLTAQPLVNLSGFLSRVGSF